MTAKGPDYLASVRLLARFLGGSRLLLAASLIAAIVGAFLEILPIWLLTEVIRAALAGTLTADRSLEMAAATLVGIAACFVATGLTTSLGHLAAFRAIHRMRIAIVEHMARVPLGFLHDIRQGEAKRLVLDDPEQLEGLLAHGLPDSIGAFCVWAAISIWLLLTDWVTALAAILPAMAGLAALALAMKRSAGLAMNFQAASMRMSASIVETLAAISVLKVFKGGIGTGNPRREILHHTRAQTAMSRDYIPFGTAFTTLIAANVAFILPVGLLRLDQGVLDAAGLLFVIILGAGYSQPLLKLFAQFHRLAAISLSSTLAGDLLAIEQQQDTGKARHLPDQHVQFKNVTFGYGSAPVLRDVSFRLPQRQMTALVGPSGAGKTTIASLLPRLFDIGSGAITIGDVDIRDLSLAKLQKTVALVPQIPFLFDDTLAENIRIGNPDADDAEVEAGMRAAQLGDFLDRLPDGLQTRLGRGGIAPSGGERQRIAIARLILKDAPIIALDEATAFCDAGNEMALIQAIEALAKRRTVLVIAHRLETVRRAGQILVLNQGRIREQGTHDELLGRDGLYRHLWQASLPQDHAEPFRTLPEHHTS